MLWNVGKSEVIHFKFVFKQRGFPMMISFYADLILRIRTGSNQLEGKLCQNVKIPCEKKNTL